MISRVALGVARLEALLVVMSCAVLADTAAQQAPVSPKPTFRTR